jgi:hypothetical protein
MTYPSIRIEGAILSPDILERLEDAPGQNSSDFGLDSSAKVKDEIARAWADAQDYWRIFQRKLSKEVNSASRIANGGTDSHSPLTIRHSPPFTTETRQQWIMPLLGLLGYQLEHQFKNAELNGKTYAISHRAINRAQTPVHIIGYRDLAGLDQKPAVRATGQQTSRISPHAMLQEYLNLHDQLYGIVTNGRVLRLLRDSSRLVKLSYLEFDLDRIFTDGLFADFAILYRLLHATRLPVTNDTAAECLLERYHQDSIEQGTRIREGLRAAVTEALEIFGTGFIANPKNTELLSQLDSGKLPPAEFFNHLLRLIYRLLFLNVVEERDLIFPKGVPSKTQNTYYAYYSVQRLRRLARTRGLKSERHYDAWASLLATFQIFENPDLATKLGTTAFGGTLFNAQSLGPLSTCRLSNAAFFNALDRLCSFDDSTTKQRLPVNFGALATEEFGSVYESLLELHPVVQTAPAPSFAFKQSAGNDRKTSGSYYTPACLVDCLLDSALDPVMEERLAEAGRMVNSEWRVVAEPYREEFIQYANQRLSRSRGVAAGTASAGTTHSGPSTALPGAQPPAEAELVSLWLKTPLAIRYSLFASQALLRLRVCDPACGSGHFLIAAAQRIARRLALVRAGDAEPAPDQMRHALREVIGHCIYGVDINPMSVELCRVALWLEAVEPGKPLSFLNHHIQCGNSLLGTTPALMAKGIPDEAFDPIEGDDKKYCANFKKANKQEARNIKSEVQDSLFDREQRPWDHLGNLAASVAHLSNLPDDTPDQIHDKEKRYAELVRSSGYLNGHLLADAWCAAFVWIKRPPTPTTSDLSLQHSALPDGFDYPITNDIIRKIDHNPYSIPPWMREEIQRLARQYKFFHWHLEFPDVFGVDGKGGFDIILGNPPWDMQEVKDNEFFATTFPEILSVKSAKDKESILARIQESAPILWQSYQKYVRETYGQRHLMANSGRYPLAATGRMNLYRLFLETGHTVVSMTGRVGIVLPSGFATDSFSQDHFSSLHGDGRLISLYDFENRLGLFPGVDSRYRFCLLTVGGRGVCSDTDFVFFAQSVFDLADRSHHIRLSQQAISVLNPLTQTAPLFRSRHDYVLALKIQKAGPIIGRNDGECSWGIKPMLMFMMNAAMKEHRTAEELEADGYRVEGNRYVHEYDVWLPFYEGKMVGAYDHRAASIRFDPTNRVRRNQSVALSEIEHKDPAQLALPMFWVKSTSVAKRCENDPRWCLCIKDVTSSTNERTAIAAMLAGVALTDSLPCLSSQQSAIMMGSLLGNINSLPFDYVARQKIGGLHLRGHYLSQLPVISTQALSTSCSWSRDMESIRQWLLPRVLELTYTAWDLELFAQDCGWSGPPFRWDEERRYLLRCELDAAFFHLYLPANAGGAWRPARKTDGCPYDETPEQLAELTRHFPTPRDAVSYIMDTFPIVKRKDEAAHGTYRTKDTILKIYDEMATAIRTGHPYETQLNPPPGPPCDTSGDFIALSQLSRDDWPKHIHLPKDIGPIQS